MPEQAKFAFIAWVVVCLAVAVPCFAVENRGATSGVVITATTAQPKATNNLSTYRAKPLTLEDAVQRMLAGNQQLQAQHHALAASIAAGRQLAARPNPELSLEFEEFGGSGEYSGRQSLQTTLAIRQLVERGGKRTQRQRLAEQQQRLAEQQRAVTRSDLINETRQRFVAVLLANKQLQLAEKQHNQAAAVLVSVNHEVASGQKAPIEALRFKALATHAQIRYQRAVATLENSRLILASSWHSPIVDFGKVLGDVQQLPPLPTWIEIEKQLERTPLLISSNQQQQLAQAELALQQANQVNNLSVALGVKSDRSSNDVALIAGLSVPLALFDRNQGAVAAASHRLSQAAAETEALRRQQRQQLMTTHRSATLIRQEIEALSCDLMPAAQAVYEASAYGYAQGKFGVIEVLDAQGRLFDSEDRYIEALTRYHQQLSELDRLLGSEFAEIRG